MMPGTWKVRWHIRIGGRDELFRSGRDLNVDNVGVIYYQAPGRFAGIYGYVGVIYYGFEHLQARNNVDDLWSEVLGLFGINKGLDFDASREEVIEYFDDALDIVVHQCIESTEISSCCTSPT
jgi:hypothetical protein